MDHTTVPLPLNFLSLIWVLAPHRTRTCERAFIFGSSMQLSPTHGAPLFLIHFRALGQSRLPPRHMMVPPGAAGGGGCRMERGGGIQPRAVASFSQRGGNKQHTHTHMNERKSPSSSSSSSVQFMEAVSASHISPFRCCFLSRSLPSIPPARTNMNWSVQLIISPRTSSFCSIVLLSTRKASRKTFSASIRG